MSKSKSVRRLAVLVICTVHFGSFLHSASAQEFSPTEFGPHNVGHRKVEILERFDGDVWYPTNASALDFSSAAYLIGGLDFPAEIALSGATIDIEAAPLLIYYHGLGSPSTGHYKMMEALASHGFVVVAPQNTQDTERVIDSFLDRNVDPTDEFFGALDGGRVGALGYSLGGDGALLAPKKHESVSAIFLISPAGIGNNLRVPAMYLTGTLDSFEPNIRIGFDAESNRESLPRYLGVIDDATHTSFWDVCFWTEFAKENGGSDAVIAVLEDAATRACTDEFASNELVLDMTTMYSVSFFRRHLNGDEDYERFLSSDFAKANQLPIEIQRVVPEPKTSLPGLLSTVCLVATLRKHRTGDSGRGIQVTFIPSSRNAG